MNPASPMPTDFDNDRVLEEWQLQESSFRLRDLLDERVRGEFMEVMTWLALGTLMFGLSVRGGLNPASGFVALLGLAVVLWSLLGLDAINCKVSPTHECRACRKETSRWRVETDPFLLADQGQLLASDGDEETDGGY